MNKELTKEQWQVISEKLAEWCEQMDLYYDYSEHWDKERYVLEAKKNLDINKENKPCTFCGSIMTDVEMANKLADTLRTKSKELMQETQNEWSGEVLHTLIGNYAGYIIGVADGIDFYLSLQEKKDA